MCPWLNGFGQLLCLLDCVLCLYPLLEVLFNIACFTSAWTFIVPLAFPRRFLLPVLLVNLLSSFCSHKLFGCIYLPVCLLCLHSACFVLSFLCLIVSCYSTNWSAWTCMARYSEELAEIKILNTVIAVRVTLPPSRLTLKVLTSGLPLLQHHSTVTACCVPVSPLANCGSTGCGKDSQTAPFMWHESQILSSDTESLLMSVPKPHMFGGTEVLLTGNLERLYCSVP